MEQVACDMCGTNKPVVYLPTRDRFTGDLYTLLQCTNCGLIYLSPRPTIEELGNHYPDDYEAYQFDNLAVPSKNRDIFRTLSRQLDFVEQYYQTPGKILDVGCATGNFLSVAYNRGWQVMGIEIVEKAASIAREKYNLNVLSTDLSASKIDPSSLDVVSLWDVLEHLPSPRAALEKIYEILKPGGMIFFSIPNLASFDRFIFGAEWIGWDTPRHFNLYDQQNMERLLENSGFSLVDRKCLTGGKGTFSLSLDRLTKVNAHLQWIKRYASLISLLLWPYRQFAYLTLRGPIIYYAARKV